MKSVKLKLINDLYLKVELNTDFIQETWIVSFIEFGEVKAKFDIVQSVEKSGHIVNWLLKNEYFKDYEKALDKFAYVFKKATYKYKEKLAKEREKNNQFDEELTNETSFYEENGRIYEEVWDGDTPRFAVWNGSEVSYVDEIKTSEGVLYPINDDAVRLRAVLLPTEAEEYESLEKLLEEIKAHIYKYLDISEFFLDIASYYVLLTWVYDKINTLPYLRALGDTGTGKSRFLDVIGRICYKASIVSGSITPAPIYRMIRRWGGTLVFDEADFKDSSEKNEVVTILNCGFERGRPVIRCLKDNPDELQFHPTFGPKVIATRFTFRDKALESRCLTEKMTQTTRDIPPLLPKEFYEEEVKLRNQLLMYRFKNRNKLDVEKAQKVKLGDIEPRLKQVTSSFAILFLDDEKMLNRFRDFLNKYNKELIEERSETFEGLIVNAIFDLKENPDSSVSDYISASDILNYLKDKNLVSEKTTTNHIGKILKSLGIERARMRASDARKRCIVWDEKKMEVLRKRYRLPQAEQQAEVNEVEQPEIKLIRFDEVGDEK